MIGVFRKREEPIEPLSAEALCARVGLSLEARPKPDAASPQPPEYLRVDGPRPTQPRSWRGGAGEPR